MVTTGFSMPFIAKYENNGETVTYTEGMDFGRGVSLDLEIQTATDNKFYANNVISESETAKFTSGTATITIDGLDTAAAGMVFGIKKTKEITIGEKTVQMIGYGEGMKPEFCGFGCVRTTQNEGEEKYWPYILPKVKLGIPKDSMKTRGESIDWQTQEISAIIHRDDTAEKNWKLVSKEGMDSEAEAYETVKAILGGNKPEQEASKGGENGD